MKSQTEGYQGVIKKMSKEEMEAKCDAMMAGSANHKYEIQTTDGASFIFYTAEPLTEEELDALKGLSSQEINIFMKMEKRFKTIKL